MTRFSRALAAVCAVLGGVCSAVAGLRFSGLLLFCLAAFFAVLAALSRLAGTRRRARLARRALLALFCLGLVGFGVLEALVVSGARTDAVGKNVSCVVILGAGVDGTEPSLSLRTRLDAALDYLADKPDVPVIVSGGQGRGEAISEAECMARYLTARGVDESRVWKEERSANTRANFAYSAALMAERGVDPTADFAFVTSDYHIARAKRMAGVPWAYAVAARLPRGAYYDALEANYYIREAFALANELLWRLDLNV